MKLLIGIISLFTIYSIPSFGQIPNANSHTNEHTYKDFRGNVRSCQIRNFKSNGKYHCPFMSNKNQDLMYNEQGLLIERISYDCLGYSDSLEVNTIWKYAYSNEELVDVEGYNPEKETLIKKWHYKIVNDSTKTKCSFDKNMDTIPKSKLVGLKNKQLIYQLNSENQYYIKFEEKFDEKCRTLSIKNFDEHKDLIYLKISNYDLDSIDREITYNHSILFKKNKVSKTITKANPNGEIVERIHITEKGEFEAENYFEYEYDNTGNWIKKTTRWRTDKEDEFIVHITTRIFEYY